MRKLFNILFSSVLLLIVSGQRTWAQNVGQYPFGTWASLYDVNDSGVAMGWGDVNGDIQIVGVSLFGPNAGKWFGTGVSSNDDWNGEGGGIASNGMIVASITGNNGYARAYAWTAGGRDGIDLGTLRGDSGSVAIAVNRGGTLIVGLSYGDWGRLPLCGRPRSSGITDSPSAPGRSTNCRVGVWINPGEFGRV